MELAAEPMNHKENEAAVMRPARFFLCFVWLLIRIGNWTTIFGKSLYRNNDL
jgi:hypothetical protein